MPPGLHSCIQLAFAVPCRSQRIRASTGCQVHLLSDTRGTTLESVICRMKTVARSAQVVQHQLPASRLRIMALSATLPNVADIGSFIGAREGMFQFNENFRPVRHPVPFCQSAWLIVLSLSPNLRSPTRCLSKCTCVVIPRPGTTSSSRKT